MAISFPCDNLSCGKMVRAPDGTEGKKARCPMCGTVQVIPASLDELTLPPLEFADEPPPAAGPPSVRCAECGAILPPAASLCSQCGWVNPKRMGPPPVPVPQAASTDGGTMEIDCLKAVAYGFSNFISLFKLVLFSIGLGIGLDIIRGFFDWLIFFGVGGMIIVVLVSLSCEVVISGYFLRFYLDCVIGSLEGSDQAPNVPAFDLNDLFKTGIKGLGVLCVYILPIITIPLLPLGLLAWGYSDDMRMFDLRWAVRAAVKKPGKLVMLWLIIILWGVIGTGVLVVVVFLAVMAIAAILGQLTQGLEIFFVGMFLWGVAGFFIGFVFHTFMAVEFRCIGMLGRHNRDLLDLLPEETSVPTVAGGIVGGIALSIVVLYGSAQLIMPKSYTPSQDTYQEESEIEYNWETNED